MAIALYVPVHSLGWPIYAVRVLQGAADGTARAALFALVFDILPQGRRGEAMALFSLSGQGPAALGPPIGEALLKFFGFNVLFGAAALLCADCSRGHRDAAPITRWTRDRSARVRGAKLSAR